MSTRYEPYLIAKYATGFDKEVQPWLLPDDAQDSLLNGFVYRGVWNKRSGFNQFAIGLQGGTPYTESRMVHRITAEAYGSGTGITGPYTHTAANIPLRRGTIVITAGAQSAADNGLGVFVTTPPGGTGTVNYTTGQMSVTFNAVVAGATAITVTYDYHPGLPVMMNASFYTEDNIRQLIVADTMFVNRFNSTTNRLDDISGSAPYTGTNFDFFSWVNYPDAENNPRLIFVNNVDPIQQYDGTAVTNYSFTLTDVTTLTTLLLFQLKDRLILLRTTEDGTIFGRRIRISGTGANCDVFDTTASGAGVIDIPDNSWIYAATPNRDDLLIWTQTSSWILKYTGNDVVPFTLDRIDDSRGSGAPYSGITYLNRSTTLSPTGFIISDGYRVERMDDKIPDYSFDDIDQTNFALCFAGTVDLDRDHYLIHPSTGQGQSDRILVTNYEEDNFSVYDIRLSCMGSYIESFGSSWNDLNKFANWNEMSAAFNSWNEFSYMKDTPIAIGGGHNGQIWRIISEASGGENASEDADVRIYNITIIDQFTIQVTTDYNNYQEGDYVYITGILGMAEANDKQGYIPSAGVISPYVFNLILNSTDRFSTYTSGGTAYRVIPFQSTTKKFNPYAMQAAKVRCGYMYFYVSATTTWVTRNVNISGISKATEAVVTADNHQFETGDIVAIVGVSGMTEINGSESVITVIDENSFSLNAVDSSGFTTYTSGGVAQGPEPAFISVDVTVNDNFNQTVVENSSGVAIQNPYRVYLDANREDEGSKRWYKVFINQTGRFIQFTVNNIQAGTNIEIQAMMPGFMPVGRLI